MKDKRFVIRIDSEKHLKFKMEAILANKSLQQYLTEILELGHEEILHRKGMAKSKA